MLKATRPVESLPVSPPRYVNSTVCRNPTLPSTETDEFTAKRFILLIKNDSRVKTTYINPHSLKHRKVQLSKAIRLALYFSRS